MSRKIYENGGVEVARHSGPVRAYGPRATMFQIDARGGSHIELDADDARGAALAILRELATNPPLGDPSPALVNLGDWWHCFECPCGCLWDVRTLPKATFREPDPVIHDYRGEPLAEYPQFVVSCPCCARPTMATQRWEGSASGHGGRHGLEPYILEWKARMHEWGWCIACGGPLSGCLCPPGTWNGDGI